MTDYLEIEEFPGFDGDPSAPADIDTEPNESVVLAEFAALDGLTGGGFGLSGRRLNPFDAWVARFVAALAKHHKGRVVYCKGFRTRGQDWSTPTGLPLAHLHHHTASASTTSTDPKHKGNRRGANASLVKFIINAAARCGWANFVIDRDGTIFVVGLRAQWHAGLGDFAGTRWAKLGIRANRGNTSMLGTEVVSKGGAKDFTKAQMQAIDALNVTLRESLNWPGFKLRLPNHKDWTARKIDTRYAWTYWLARATKAWLTRKK